MKFSVVNLGCKVNRVETDSFAAEMLARGHKLSGDSDVQLVLVNTCTVTGEADKKTRKAVRGACSSHPDALILVTGCAAAIDAATYESMSDRVLVVSKRDLFEVTQSSAMHDSHLDRDHLYARFIQLVTPCERGNEHSLEAECLTPEQIRAGSDFNTRVGIKVQDGCDNECTYCIVHTARGKAYSRPWKLIVEEAMALSEAGVKEIVLSGINLGSYGKQRDCNQKLSLAGLLEILLEKTAERTPSGEEPPRLRISSVEPCDIDDDVVCLLSTSKGRICRHLHLPLQSGSTKVLREMNRPYTAEEFVDIVDKLRKAVPELSLSTDVIAGFPGETEEEFLETLHLCERCGFSKIHVFPYSMRAGTPAADRADQIPPHIKADRAARLRNLGKSLRRQDYCNRIGSFEAVIVEGDGKGVTESYFEIDVPLDAPRGALIHMALPSSFRQ